MQLQPINDNILVKISTEEQKVQNGITIANPTGLQQKQNKGVITAVGDGRITLSGERIPLRVKVGDQILFNKFAGTEIINGEDKYVIILESDILAIIT